MRVLGFRGLLRSEMVDVWRVLVEREKLLINIYSEHIYIYIDIYIYILLFNVT